MHSLSSDAIVAAFRRAAEERAFWNAHRGEFLAAYPDQFVAVKDGRVVATGRNLEEIVARLTAIGLRPTDIWMQHFDAHPAVTLF